VTELQAYQAKSTASLSREFVLEALLTNLRMAMGKSPINLIKYSKDKGWHTHEGYQYDGGAVAQTLTLLGKELSMFVDKKEVGGPGDFGRLSDDELRAFIRERYSLKQPLELTAEHGPDSNSAARMTDITPIENGNGIDGNSLPQDDSDSPCPVVEDVQLSLLD
jgi:hypothetical protein